MMKRMRFIITIVEPVGVLISYESAIPETKHIDDTIAEVITTDLKLLHMCIDVIAGNISSDDIRRAPMILIPITTVIAVRKAMSIL